MLKIALGAAIAACLAWPAAAQYQQRNTFGNSYGSGFGTGSNSSSHSVQGHYNSNGTYTQPHMRTNPNNTQMDNFGTRGNYNPYTGRSGTRSLRY
jgi:hypothetical protein